MDIWVQISLWVPVFNSVLYMLRSEVTESNIILFLIFWGRTILFSTVDAAFQPTVYRVPIFPNSPRHIIFCLFFYFVIVAILISVWWCLIVVWTEVLLRDQVYMWELVDCFTFTDGSIIIMERWKSSDQKVKVLGLSVLPFNSHVLSTFEYNLAFLWLLGKTLRKHTHLDRPLASTNPEAKNVITCESCKRFPYLVKNIWVP